jgi:hypothetical protein
MYRAIHLSILLTVVLSSVSAAPVTDFRLCTFGNSLTMSIKLGELIDLAASRNQQLCWERVGIAGTSLDFLWNNREQPICELLAKGNWDALSLQPFNRGMDADLPMVQKYIQAALPDSPDITAYIFAQYIHDAGFDYQEIKSVQAHFWRWLLPTSWRLGL